MNTIRLTTEVGVWSGAWDCDRALPYTTFFDVKKPVMSNEWRFLAFGLWSQLFTDHCACVLRNAMTIGILIGTRAW